MLKLTVALLAVALVASASASAEGWRLDAGSHRAFKRSLEAAKEELSPENIQMLGGALKHIWNEGTKVAEAADQRYSDKDYFRQLDGLSYEEVVHFTDETYDAAQAQYLAALDDAERATPGNEFSSSRAPGSVPPQRYRYNETGTFDRSWHSGYETRGGTDLVGVPGQR